MYPNRGEWMPDGTVGLRARKRLQTRQRIEDCALRLFTQRGFDAVTVEEICAAADVSHATFYRYFGAKEEVVFAYRNEFQQGLRDAIGAAAEEPSPAAQVRSVLMCFAGFLQSQAGTLARCDQLVLHHSGLFSRTLAVQRDWERELAEGLARLRAVPPEDSAVLLHAALGLAVLRVAIRRWRAGQARSLPAATSHVLADTRQFFTASGPPARPGAP
jgi:AcrR family transcriptional regulator